MSRSRVGGSRTSRSKAFDLGRDGVVMVQLDRELASEFARTCREIGQEPAEAISQMLSSFVATGGRLNGARLELLDRMRRQLEILNKVVRDAEMPALSDRANPLFEEDRSRQLEGASDPDEKEFFRRVLGSEDK